MSSTPQSTAKSIAAQVATHLAPAFSVLGPDLDAYVRAHQTDRWMVFSDYVWRQKGRKVNTAAFTVVPGGNHFESNVRAVVSAARTDFKNASTVSDEMLELLGDKRFYTFCFVSARDELFQFTTVDGARAFIESAVDILGRALDVRGYAENYEKFRILQQESRSKNFNFRLLGDILFISTLAAHIALQLARRTKVNRFAWFSDRDKFVDAYQGIADAVISVVISEYWQEVEKGSAGPSLIGVARPELCTDRAWFDCMTRIPDYYAGAVAGWDLSSEVHELPLKYRQVLSVSAQSEQNMRIIRVGNKAVR